MRATRTPAEVFPPGDFVREELEARRWTQGDLASVIGRPVQVVNEIVNGRKGITAQTAKQLAAAFGTSAELWLNLESTYRLATAEDPDPMIATRARDRSLLGERAEASKRTRRSMSRRRPTPTRSAPRK
jgi:HTH-type transcriptional regulator/antitoxin HigA